MFRQIKLSAEQKRRESQWLEDKARIAINGRRLWRCWHCDNLSPWTRDHRHYSSVREEDDGVPFPVMCSAECQQALVAQGIVPPAYFQGHKGERT